MRALVICLLLATALPCQLPPEPPGHSQHGSAFDEGPRQAAHLMPGMSDQVHLPVAGLSAEAQAFFDQGVTQLHGFWYFEAERSFRQVLLLQPGCAMAYWGMAMANVENKPRAAGLIAHAVRCSADVPAYEQRWIDAWATYYQVGEHSRDELRCGDPVRVQARIETITAKNGKRDEKPLAKQLVRDLEAMVFEFPADIEGKAFLAMQNWLNTDWGKGIPISSYAGVDALLEQVLQQAPLHPAHHYRVHLWDREAAERALASAAVLGCTAPGIAHQWHMAGHIYAKLHRHAEAAWQQEASARVDHAQMQRDRVMPFLIHNYGHNQEWLARSLSYGGRVPEALAVAKNLAALPRHPKWNTLDDDEHIAAYARTRLVSLCEEHELWQQALQLEQDGHLDRSESVRGELLRLGLLGRALFRLGRLDEAERLVGEVEPLLAKARAARAAAVDGAEAVALAEKAAAKVVREAMDEAGREPTDLVRAVLDLQRELRGEHLLAHGDAKGAVAEFEAIDGLPKTLLADALVAAGEAPKAIELLAAEVKERPNRLPATGRLLLAHVAAHAQDPAHDRARARELLPQVVAMGVGGTPRSPFEARVDVGVDDGSARSQPGTSLRLVAADGAPLFPEAEEASFPADFGQRPPLDSLGPVAWTPFAAADFDLPCATGGRRTLAQQRGKPVLVVFYLGFGCLHCVEQLEALSPKANAFAAAGVDVVAIGNESLATAQDNLAALGEAAFAFPLLADPDLAAFRAWRCHDDFESMPLHGTFLVDGDGKVRWQDISAEPFTQFDWLLQESRRLLALRSSP
jgi:peroxiredoxin/tetratricopeptide (TPR) repeat protein